MTYRIKRTKHYSKHLAEELSINRNHFTDVVIKVGDQGIPCHRLILMANSPVLKAIILSDMKEASSGEIHLDQFPYDVVSNIIEYMYTGSTKFSCDQLVGAVCLTHFLNMSELHGLCASYVPKILTPGNVVEWLQLATLQKLPNITTSTKELIGRAFSEISQEQQFVSLGLAEVREMINAGKEEKAHPDYLLQAVFRYVSHDREDRIKDLDVLIQPISFHDCSANTLAEIQDKYSDILDTNPVYYKRVAQSTIETKISAEASKPLSIIVLGRRRAVWMLDDKNKFSEISQFPHTARYHVAACVTDLGVLVTGGYAAYDKYHDSGYCCRVYLFIQLTQQWKQLQPMSHARGYHASVHYGGIAYVLGGYGFRVWSSNVEKLNLTKLNPGTEQWQDAPQLPTALAIPKACVLCGLIYMMGNCDTKLYVFDPQTQRWTTRAQLPIHPGRGFSIAAGMDHLYVAGGNQNLCAVYSPSVDAWKLITQKPKLRHELGAMVMRGKTLVILGGGSADVEQYDTEKEVWSTLDVKIPKSLANHQAVVMDM